MTSEGLLEAYENIRDILPSPRYAQQYERVLDLESLTGRYDAFFFDAFGVLNIGNTAIEGAAQRVVAVRKAGRQVRIVSNAAGAPIHVLHERYRTLGFDFQPEEIVTSRVALIHYLRTQPACHWGVMAPAGADTSDLGVEHTNLSEHQDAFEKVDGFILLSSTGWTDALQSRLILAITARRRPVLLANPDLAAPVEGGFSVQPGHLAAQLTSRTGCQPLGFGKPYGLIFQIALDGLSPAVAPERVLMIGDTLHTDVLGGCGAGLDTALVTAQGASASLDWAYAIEKTGIVPHYVLDSI